MAEASPRSILVFSGRYHIISNASLVNNCIINDDNVNVPAVANYDIVNELSSIILTPAEIEVVLKSLPFLKSGRT